MIFCGGSSMTISMSVYNVRHVVQKAVSLSGPAVRARISILDVSVHAAFGHFIFLYVYEAGMN